MRRISIPILVALLALGVSPFLRGQAPVKDTIVVKDSQENALEQVQGMEEKAADGRAKALLKAVEQEMDKALKHLSKATNSPASLSEALAAEQAAYQALLKLSAHEYQVSRSRNRSQQGQSGAQQRNQRQVDELDLKQSENKYETQRQANPQQTPEQREQLQVLNRLKELAQRQQDLNERLKEMQTALQEAKTEQEREEIRRRLKRLREEEQQMLADLDELRQRMDRPENQSRMADAKQQLDQTRSQVQQATEALDKESVSDALASGTRAQRDLQQLRDDFRKKNSSQFSEEMRQMRSEARELAQKQEEIGKKLDTLVDNQRKTLSDSGDSKALGDQLQQQKNTLTNLLENMRRVSEQAETAEPLLSKQLYDTLRKANQDEARNIKDSTQDLLRSGALSRSLYDKLKNSEQDKGAKSLELTSDLLDQKLLPQAGQSEQRARQGIEEIKRGVEHAAESILGDDTEALRQAKRELDDLTRQLDNEIAQAETANQSKGQQDGKNGQQQQGEKGQGGQNSEQAQKGQQQANSQDGQQQGQSGKGQSQNPEDQQKDSQAQAGQDQNQQKDQANQARGQRGQGQGQGQKAQNQNQQGEGQGQGQRAQNQNPQGQGQGQGQNKNQQAQAQNQNQNQPGQNGQGQGQGQGQGRNGQRQQNAQNQQGQPNSPGQPNDGQPAGEQQAQTDQAQPTGQPGFAQGNRGQRTRSGQRAGASNRSLRDILNEGGPNTEGGAEGGSITQRAGPLTSEEFNTWSDRLRDVEEMVDLPQVRTDVARVRERARTIRQESKQTRQKPDWAVVKLQIAKPLAEVRDRITEELARRQNAEALVPIDRDPVPNKFSDLVRKYYEKLGGAE